MVFFDYYVRLYRVLRTPQYYQHMYYYHDTTPTSSAAQLQTLEWIISPRGTERGLSDSESWWSSEAALKEGQRSSRPYNQKYVFIVNVHLSRTERGRTDGGGGGGHRCVCGGVCGRQTSVHMIESQKHSLQVVGHYKKHHYKPLVPGVL